MYDFNKVRSPEGDNVYTNPHFKRGNKNSLRKIQRKVPSYLANGGDDTYPMTENRVVLWKNNDVISELQKKQESLENKYMELIKTNQALLE